MIFLVSIPYRAERPSTITKGETLGFKLMMNYKSKPIIGINYILIKKSLKILLV